MDVQRSIRPQHSGFSLVELLIALGLGMMLIIGMGSVFAGNKRSSDLNSAMANVQESARFAMAAIGRDIRQAGFQGCLESATRSVTVRASAAPTTDLTSTAVSGGKVLSSSIWTPAPPSGFTPPAVNAAVPGTHALYLQYADSNTSTLIEQMNVGFPSSAGPVKLEKDIGLRSGHLAVISNCADGDLFEVTGYAADGTGALIEHAASANGTGNLSKAYGDVESRAQTMVSRFHANIYYVGNTGLVNEQGDEILALYQQSWPYNDPVGNPAIELIQGIENMRVSFGIRSGTGELQYVSPDHAAFNPRRVESVRVGLLMASWESISDHPDEQTYVLAGDLVPPAPTSGTAAGPVHARDKRIRLAFNTTIKVRNRHYRD